MASFWQCASAPARPPKSAPLTGLTLVMKKPDGPVAGMLAHDAKHSGADQQKQAVAVAGVAHGAGLAARGRWWSDLK